VPGELSSERFRETRVMAGSLRKLLSRDIGGTRGLTCTIPELSKGLLSEKTTGGHAMHIGNEVAFKIVLK